MNPDRRFAVIVLDNRGGAPMEGLTDFVAQRAAGIAPVPPPALPAERDANADERARLVGTYKMGTTTVSLIESEGALRFQQGPMSAPARLVGDERLVITPPQGAKVTLILVRGANGRVEYVHQGGRSLARQP